MLKYSKLREYKLQLFKKSTDSLTQQLCIKRFRKQIMLYVHLFIINRAIFFYINRAISGLLPTFSLVNDIQRFDRLIKTGKKLRKKPQICICELVSSLERSCQFIQKV